MGSDGPDRAALGSSIDLATNAVLLAIAVTAVLLELPALLRIPFGTLLVLVLPGHALVCALFPSDDGPDGVARAALSVALSLATVPPVALVIDRSPWRIERTTMTVGLVIVAAAGLLAAVVLRHRLPAGERYGPQLDRPVLPQPRAWTREQQTIAGLLLVAGLLFAFGGYEAARSRIFGEPLTEFAMYNSDGEARFYPREVVPGEPVAVQLEITNREHTDVQYRVVVAGNGVGITSPAPVTLADGETWRREVRFTVNGLGEQQEIHFLLYRADREESPYRSLTLVVDGVAPP